jgi:hypothetical protein
MIVTMLATAPVRAQNDGEGASGPPQNLKGGPFQGVVDAMWRDSPTFRHQCLRLAAARVRVTITVDVTQPPSFARSKTEMFRHRGVLLTADVVLFSLRDTVELIAHEVEHVIEQLDGVELRTNACEGSTSPRGFYESCRAVEAGRQVAREVREAEVSRTAAR